MKNDNNNEIRPMTLQEISAAAKKRVALISREFSDGFEFLKSYPRSVSIFGSARTKEGEKYYEISRNLARRIAEELKYAIITGGGPGIMGAANRGAFEGGGNSLGLTIRLPREQITNPYITNKIDFHYFFTRKVCLAYSAEAYIFFPGGFGTLDEFSEILTLVQTNKIPKAPIILFGSEFWNPFVKCFKTEMLEKGFIEAVDLDLFIVSDSDDEVINIIKEAPIRHGVAYNESADDSEASNKHEIESTPLGSFSNIKDKHCIPCEGDAKALSSAESKSYLKDMNEWELVDDKKIIKTFEFDNFGDAMDFMNDVADIAEDENHHPDMKLHDYKKVDVHISTHAIDGLTENDFILASKIDQILR